jgi:hypothetical protein
VPGLRVLITNATLSPRSGTVVYVRDLAMELQRRGHAPSVFSSTAGDVADELRDAGIPVSDRSGALPAPDVIHGHHYAPTLLAVRRWRSASAIHVCHDHRLPQDRTPLHPRIRRHFGVSRLAVARLIAEGVPRSSAALLPNFVDTRKLVPRAPLPDRPRRALAFSNSAHRHSIAKLRASCQEAAIELDVVGPGLELSVADPDALLAEYDVVFAKGRAALGAMAVGNAVIACDYDRIGSMITTANFEELRQANFGFGAMREALDREGVLGEIARYDALDAARVRDRVRERADLATAVDELLEIYAAVLQDASTAPSSPEPRQSLRALRASAFLGAYWRWAALPQRRKDRILGLPGMRRVAAAVRRVG